MARREQTSVFTVPAEGAGTGPAVPLTVYDLTTGHVFTHRLLFFHKSLDGAELRASLARTLRSFPLLAGRARRDPDGEVRVHCENAGARFLQVLAADPMPEYGPQHPPTAELKRYYQETSPYRVVDRDTPLLVVKLTQMAGGGSALGVSIDHALVDGASFMQFLACWSSEHRGLGYPEPCHDRSIVEELSAPARDGGAERGSTSFAVASRRQRMALIARLLVNTRKTSTVRLRYTAEEVQAVKDAVMADLDGTGQWVSTNDALVAHLWQCVGRLRARPDEARETLGLISDLRIRLGDAVPSNYFGNAVTNTLPTMTAGELRSRPLGSIAEAVRSGANDNSLEKVRAEVAFLRAQRAAGRSKQVISRMALDCFDGSVSLNNYSKIPFYQIDLGAGTPFWYEPPHSLIPYSVSIVPTPEQDGGRDVTLVLPKDRARAVRSDDWQARLHRHTPAVS